MNKVPLTNIVIPRPSNMHTNEEARGRIGVILAELKQEDKEAIQSTRGITSVLYGLDLNATYNRNHGNVDAEPSRMLGQVRTILNKMHKDTTQNPKVLRFQEHPDTGRKMDLWKYE